MANPANTGTPTPLRAPIYDALVNLTGDQAGLATKLFQDWLTSIDRRIPAQNALAINVNGRGNGTTDDTAAIQTAISQAIAAGGATVHIPAGTYSINSISIPAGDTPVNIVGEGLSTVLIRRDNQAGGVGLLDISGSNVSISDLVIDGNTPTPKGLQYNLDFQGVTPNDPMAASLTTNSSIWVHGPASMFSMNRVLIRHTGGYAVLLDATTGDITDVDIVNCWFLNNRPFLFGTVPGQLIYGSWGGGVFAKGDGRAVGSGVVRSLFVSGCRFQRCTGNCAWSHLYSLVELHEDFRFIGNFFVDCGLDGIEIGGVTSGVVANNVFRRIGYVCLSDTGPGIPRWLANAQATALDSSGIVKGCLYACNTFMSVNGGALDLDGHCLSSLVGNSVRIPYPDEPEFAEDQIAITGPNNNGSASYGLNLGNTQMVLEGGTDIQISGNSFINLAGGSIRLYAARRCHVSANNIIAPANSLFPPIGMGPLGPNPGQRCFDNVISFNHIDYAPPVAAVAIFEDSTYSAFLNTESNTVRGNVPITGGGGPVTEFQKAPGSNSTVWSMQVWF